MVLKTILVDMCKLDLHNFHKVSSPKLGPGFAKMIPLRLYGNIHWFISPENSILENPARDCQIVKQAQMTNGQINANESNLAI